MDKKWLHLFEDIGELRFRTAALAGLLSYQMADRKGLSPEMLQQQVKDQQLRRVRRDIDELTHKLKEHGQAAIVAGLLQDNLATLRTILHFQTRLFARSQGISVEQAGQIADDQYELWKDSDDLPSES